MKKILSTFLIFIASITMISCKKTESIPTDINSPIVFSKIMTDPEFDVSAIEIYNPSEKEVDLTNHFIEIYPSSTNKISTVIDLEGTIGAKGFHFIVHEGSSEKALELADQLYEGKYLRGDEAIVLKAGKTQKDIISSIGAGYSYINSLTGATFVRKPDRLIQREKFVISDYIEFLPNRYEMLSSLDIGLTEEDFKYGPRLSDEDRSLPFYLGDNKKLGGGGVAEVTVASYNDGDTTRFNYPKELGITSSTRYYFIDTPETQSTRVEEFGHPASNFTNDILKEAEELNIPIEVQAIKGLSTDGGFGRFFGMVYVDGYSLSYLLLRLGLADIGVSAGSEYSETDYKGLTLESWMNQAYYYAQDNELGIHGQKDPSYYYNGKDEGENIGFRVFFDKPYKRDERYKVVRTESELIKAIENNSIIEIANDIKLDSTINIDSINNLKIIGFGNLLTSDNILFEIKNSENIIIENIKLKSNIIANISNTELEIQGLIDLNDNNKGFILDKTSKITFGPDYPVKITSNNNNPIIIFEEDNQDINRIRNIFSGIKLEKKQNEYYLK